MKALIVNNIVIQLEEHEFPVVEEWEWIDATDNTNVGDNYNNGIFSPQIIVDDSKFKILQQLDEIDAKSIRALRTNDTTRLAALESQAQALRKQL